MINLPFSDRASAGRTLAERLQTPRGRGEALVLALPRGGVPLAAEVARALDAPLDLLLVRKLGAPGQAELAMGAIASGGVQVLNPDVISALGISDRTIDRVAEVEGAELERRTRAYRGDRPPPRITGRQVILIDDGLATGATMRAAVAAVRAKKPARLVVAVPVASAEAIELLQPAVDELVCLATPEPFLAVGRWYASFPQTSDDEVRALLLAAANRAEACPDTDDEEVASDVD